MSAIVIFGEGGGECQIADWCSDARPLTPPPDTAGMINNACVYRGPAAEAANIYHLWSLMASSPSVSI